MGGAVALLPRLSLGILAACIASAPLRAQQFDESELQGLKWRLIGPFRGGRSLAATGIPGNPAHFLFRRRLRRSLEDDQRRHHLGSHLR